MKLYQVDSFTTTPFAGNPAGVCIVEKEVSDEWMQRLAAEMNLSETAFVQRQQNEQTYSLRWFTPLTEVDLCGHATLASAHILYTEGMHDPSDTISFTTKSGVLTAASRGHRIELDFPLRNVEKVGEYHELSAALGASPVGVYRHVSDEETLYLFELSTPDEVKRLKPNFGVMAGTNAQAVIVTSNGGATGYDFVSRFFAPAIGINEDPVTGYAHCYLAPFWAARYGKMKLTGYQASPRGGVVFCSTKGDRVILGGNAVTVFRAELLA
ncbi:MAG: PhzF family phenazine biosynthesis protein [Spirochaetales bacterium]|nr:PhzF family phenazine biosynthesis protein [Spirochaetales bacterium]